MTQITTKTFDLIAIGGGSGGLSVVERAASHGARCALVESGELGGTCVNRGCVPKKVMWYGAAIAHMLRDAPDYGFTLGTHSFDWATLTGRRDQYIGGINRWYHTYLADSDVFEIHGHGRFLDNHTLEVEAERYRAAHIVLAPGGQPMVPSLHGAELGITSDGFFDLEQCPKRAAVVGAGYIAGEGPHIPSPLGGEGANGLGG